MASPGSPKGTGVYTRLAYYTEWIESVRKQSPPVQSGAFKREHPMGMICSTVVLVVFASMIFG